MINAWLASKEVDVNLVTIKKIMEELMNIHALFIQISLSISKVKLF